MSVSQIGAKIAGLMRAEGVGGDHVQGAPGFRLVVVVPVRVVPAPAARDLIGGQAEQEEVLFAGLVGHLDGGAVARADGEARRSS